MRREIKGERSSENYQVYYINFPRTTNPNIFWTNPQRQFDQNMANWAKITDPNHSNTKGGTK